MQAPEFSYLTETELARINTNKIELCFGVGEIIIKQGSPASHFISFNQGLAKVYIEGSQGNSLIIRLLKPNEFITGPDLQFGGTHLYSVKSVEKSSVCFIDKETIIDILRNNLPFQKEMLRKIHLQYKETLSRMINLHQRQTYGRIAESLLYLSNEIYSKNPFTLTISKFELADLSGMSKESVYKILKKFADDQLIHLDKLTVEILDEERLQHISENG